MSDIKQKDFWIAVNPNRWEQRQYPVIEEFGDFLVKLDYPIMPHILIGDEFDFTAIFEHPENGQFLFHIQIDNFSKILFAGNLPAMFYLMEQCNFLILSHFKAKKVVRDIRDE